MSILTVSKLHKLYRTSARELQALDDVSFSVDAGEFVTLVGPSGCGKSTLLKIAGGLLERTAGEVVFKGEPVLGPRRDIGIMFQTPVLFDWRTTLENVLLPTEILGLDRSESLRRARAALTLVELDGFEESYPSQLSGGMQQRVSLSRVLVYEPDLLLMDEPFGALDEFTRERLNLEIQRIWMQSRKTILFVTHNNQEPNIREIAIPQTSKFQSQIVVMRQEVYEGQRKMVVALCRGLAKAILFTHTNPNAAVAVLAKVSPAEFVDPRFGRLFLDSMIDLTRPPADALAKGEFGRNSIEAWEAYQAFLITGKTAAEGGLEKPQDLKGFITNDLVDECNSYDKERIRKMARDWK